MPWESKKLQEHLTTEKNKTNESVAQDKNCQRLNERLKSSVLSRRLKAISDGDVIMSDGRPDRSKRELRRLRKRARRQWRDTSVERAARASKRNGVDDDSPCLPHGTVRVQGVVYTGRLTGECCESVAVRRNSWTPF